VLLCTWAQLCGLASAEHAVAGPLLLAILAAMRREPLRRTLTAIAPSAALVAVYLMAKLYYLAYLRPPAAEIVLRGYGLTMDVTVWLDHLGQYLAQCFTPLTLWEPSGSSTLLLGCGLALVLALAAWRAYRAPGPWDFIAGGIALFIGSLAAVFPQRAHFGSPYICIAVLGAAWLVIGLCRLAGRQGDRLALLLAIAVLVVDARTQERAWRTPHVFRLVVNGSLTAARWMDTARRAARADHQDVLMPRNSVTGFMFEMGKAETFFPGLPKRVTLYRPSTPPRPQPEQVVLTAEAPLTTPTHFPGAQPRWNWLRALVAPPTGSMYLGADRQYLAEDVPN
jgi:hypothetical protein